MFAILLLGNILPVNVSPNYEEAEKWLVEQPRRPPMPPDAAQLWLFEHNRQATEGLVMERVN